MSELIQLDGLSLQIGGKLLLEQVNLRVIKGEIVTSSAPTGREKPPGKNSSAACCNPLRE